MQTFEWEGMPGHVSVETAEFEDLGEQTRVVTTSVFHTAEERDGMLGSGMEGGMNETYQRLDELLAAPRRLSHRRARPHPGGRAGRVASARMSPEFLLTTLILVVTPGTGVLYTVAAGLARGARAGILAAFACTLGILPHVRPRSPASPRCCTRARVAFQVVKYLGVAYLLYMAWATFRDRGALTVEEDATPRSAREVIVSGVLVNILNPKLSIFFVAFLPQFVAGGSPALPQMLALSGVFMAVTFVVFAGYGLFAASIRST